MYFFVGLEGVMIRGSLHFFSDSSSTSLVNCQLQTGHPLPQVGQIDQQLLS